MSEPVYMEELIFCTCLVKFLAHIKSLIKVIGFMGSDEHVSKNSIV